MVWLHFLYPVYVIYRCSIVEEWNRSTRDFGEKWFVKPARVKMLLSGLLFSNKNEIEFSAGRKLALSIYFVLSRNKFRERAKKE